MTILVSLVSETGTHDLTVGGIALMCIHVKGLLDVARPIMYSR